MWHALTCMPQKKRQAWCSPGGADSQLGSIGPYWSMLSCAALCSRMRQSTRRRCEDGMAGLPWNHEMISFGDILLAMESRESVAALAVFVSCTYFYIICCKLGGSILFGPALVHVFQLVTCRTWKTFRWPILHSIGRKRPEEQRNYVVLVLRWICFILLHLWWWAIKIRI